MKKPKFKKGKFKLQVYVPISMVKDVDKICDKQRIYRSEFVYRAIDKALQAEKEDA